MSDDPEPFALNAPQRRRFEVVLASLEDALARVEELTGARGPDTRALTHVEHDVPSHFARSTAPLIASLRRRITTLAQAMALEPRRPSTRRTIRALLTAQIVHLQDSGSQRLRAYGNVDRSIPERLDPELDALVRDLSGMLDALRDRGGDAARDGGV